eukprot:CAMPEP_0116931168 /NCGR_PEP_ID=MMETSP0467-20121206/27651_1 /TAXON_ID=283647 /ORGANISM="Mesodinium pulex, Strain SPMC105" /LENGTH=63 /DNA_ID=CAMNT_0004611547 /DNA_START=58 /DNA_END=249 /DNA_ORIENTATION=-
MTLPTKPNSAATNCSQVTSSTSATQSQSQKMNHKEEEEAEAEEVKHTLSSITKESLAMNNQKD